MGVFIDPGAAPFLEGRAVWAHVYNNVEDAASWAEDNLWEGADVDAADDVELGAADVDLLHGRVGGVLCDMEILDDIWVFVRFAVSDRCVSEAALDSKGFLLKALDHWQNRRTIEGRFSAHLWAKGVGAAKMVGNKY